MKQSFENAGVAHVQWQVLSLPMEERVAEIQKIRTDFTTWMLSKFSLNANQLRQLSEMSEALRNEIAEGIADSWEEGVLVNFNKDEGDDEDEDDRGAKEIIFEKRAGKSALLNHPDDKPLSTIAVSIWIRYRDL